MIRIHAYLASILLINQRGTITPRLRGQPIPPRTLAITRRVLRGKAKAHAARPIIDGIKRVAPTHGIADSTIARRNLRPVVDVVRRTQVYTIVQRVYRPPNHIVDAVRVEECHLACFAELHDCRAKGCAVDCVVGGRAVA